MIYNDKYIEYDKKIMKSMQHRSV